MKADNPIKHFLLAFLIALGCYLAAYHGIEYRRNRKGPWQVTFTNNTAAAPEIIVNQPRVHGYHLSAGHGDLPAFRARDRAAAACAYY